MSEDTFTYPRSAIDKRNEETSAREARIAALEQRLEVLLKSETSLQSQCAVMREALLDASALFEHMGQDVQAEGCMLAAKSDSGASMLKELQALRAVAAAARALREAQKAYMANRGNDTLGKAVAAAAQRVDAALDAAGEEKK